MVLYKYIAIDPDGKKIKGLLEADNEKEAEQTLNQKNNILVELKSNKNVRKKKPTKQEVLSLTEELSKLVHAGIPLYNALTALADKYEKQNIYPIIVDLADKIKRGKNFSEALSFYPNTFDLIYCSMIANSEKTGTLPQALDELAAIMQRGLNLKKKISSALLYPSILGLFCAIVIGSLIFFVIPSIADLFEGKRLHPITKCVLAVSRAANAYKGHLILSSCLFSVILLTSLCLKKVKENIYRTILQLPLIKNLMIKVSLVRFCRSFSVLLSTGIPYIEALKLAKEVTKHPLLKKDLTYAEKKILEGERLTQALKRANNIPPLVIRMLEIAEESGKSSEMLTHIAKIYEDELERSLVKITSILQPVLLLFLGTVVGFIVLSVLLPLTDVSAFIE